jgi:threonine aldolase
MFNGIDLSSDTVTKPTIAMKQAMINASVGDEQKGEDPTTKELEKEMAKILGKSNALFFPSATMCNQVAIFLHTAAGDEVIGPERCHIFINEVGGAAFHSRVQTKMIKTPSGIFTPEEIRYNISFSPGYLAPKSSLLLIENTYNSGGGSIWPLPLLSEVIKTAKEFGLKIHLDGSRLFNAAIASHCSVYDLALGFDSVTICFSKGLGCATGAILAFDNKDFDKVRRLKQVFGGSMRQSGMLSAACLYALEHHVKDLGNDHDKAKQFALGLAKIQDIFIENKNPDTNMVYFAINKERMAPDSFLLACLGNNLRFSSVGPNRFRAVMHRDIEAFEIDKAIKILQKIFS